MLTDAQIRACKVTDKPVKLFDGGGLFLLAVPKGGRWWRLKYRFAGRERGISLGVYPHVTLKVARARRKEARRLLAEGIDPSMNRRDVNGARMLSTLTWGHLRDYARKHRISDDTQILCQIPEQLENWTRIAYSFRGVGGRTEQWSALPPFQPHRVEIDGQPVLMIEMDY